MKTIHWNGENWYECHLSIFTRIRRWIIWIGGWEKPNGKGWKFRYSDGKFIKDPTPISLFGHLFTHLGWGWELRTKRGYLVWSRAGHELYCYLSPDGTPGRATIWYIGFDKYPQTTKHTIRRWNEL